MMHAASVTSASRRDSEGFAACRRSPARVQILESQRGFCLRRLQGETNLMCNGEKDFGLLREQKAESRTLALKMELRPIDLRGKPENGGSWSREGFGKLNGAPWETYPGAGGGAEL